MLTAEEFNREIHKERELNYIPLSRYLLNDPKSDLFYNICNQTKELLVNQKDNEDYKKYMYTDDYEDYRKRKYKDGSRRRTELLQDDNPEKLDALAESILSLKEKFRYFDFEKFYIMLMSKYRLLLDEDDDARQYMVYDQGLKMELLKRLKIKGNRDHLSYYVQMRYRSLSPQKRMLYRNLIAIRDPFLFDIRGKKIIVGWTNKSNKIKHVRNCEDNTIIEQYNDITDTIIKGFKKREDKNISQFRENYTHFKNQISTYMEEQESGEKELGEAIANLTEAETTDLLKQLELYRKMYRFYL